MSVGLFLLAFLSLGSCAGWWGAHRGDPVWFLAAAVCLGAWRIARAIEGSRAKRPTAKLDYAHGMPVLLLSGEESDAEREAARRWMHAARNGHGHRA